MNNRQLSWRKYNNNHFIIASRAYFQHHHHDDLSMLMVAPHGCVSWWSWSIFNEKQVVFHQCSLLVTHKDDILRQFTLVALETQSSFTLVQFSLGFYDRWAQNVAGSPVIQPKAGAVKAPELSLYYSSIYISGSLSACSLGFALSTCSPHYIYVTRLRFSVHLLGFAIFIVSNPLFTRFKQDCVGLLSLSPP